MAATYKHEALPPGDNIRILLLQPSLDFNSDIECSLRQISLEDVKFGHDYYDAMSYVWGFPMGDQPISCDGETVLVTPNCLSALRYLRLESETRVLWIDAICIDQRSTQERNNQVRLMGRLYKLARHVLIWLGEGDEEVHQIFSMLKSSNFESGEAVLTESMLSCSVKELERDTDPVNLVQLRGIRKGQALSTIIENEWFQRAWTFQELLMAKDPRFISGKQSLSWRQLDDGLTLLQATGASSLPSSASFLHISNYMKYYKTIVEEQVTSIQSFAVPGSSGNADMSPFHALAYASYHATHCLRVTRQRKSRNPLDKIFSNRQVLADLGLELPEPDYERTVTDVYTDTTIILIEKGQSLNILDSIISRKRSFDLPSWVPDYSEPIWPSDYPATGMGMVQSKGPIVIDRQKKSLAVKGRMLGVIDAIPARFMIYDHRQDARDFITYVQDHFRCLFQCFLTWVEGRRDAEASKDQRRSFAATLIPSRSYFADQYPEIFRFLTEEIMDMTEIFKKMAEKNISATDSQTCEKVVASHYDLAIFMDSKKRPLEEGLLMLPVRIWIFLSGMAFFRTKDGQFGLTAAPLELGDHIAFLSGSTHPFIVHQTKNDVLQYHLVGPVSAGSVMLEVWKLYDEEQSEGFQTITLV
jgi:hypothetical protein